MRRNPGQKIAFIFALLCYMTAFVCAVATILYEVEVPNDAVHASLMASVVFFASCGGVLHVIANTRLGGLPPRTDDEAARHGRNTLKRTQGS